MEVQRCCTCKQEKSFSEFNKSKNQPNGLHRVCKACRKIERERSKEHIKQKNKEYFAANKEAILKKNKECRLLNSDSINAQRKEYRSRPDIKKHIKQKNQEYLPIKKEKIKLKRQTDLNFKISEIYRSKYHKMIKGIETSYKTAIGCEINTLIEWLEFQFDEDMNWDNQGTYWEIDHIIPISIFDFSKNEDKRVCFNWTNLQPLSGKENRKKSDNLELHHYMNSIVNVHRFVQKHNISEGYQRLNESLIWLREKTQVR